MKLMPFQQRKELKDQEVLRDILRSQEMDKIAETARKNLAQAEADFEESMNRQQKEWEEVSEKHNEDVKRREAEISELERRREAALIPVKEIEKQAKEIFSEAEDKLKQAEEIIEENNELAEVLQDKLDDVGQREQDIARETQKLDNRSAGILLQEEQIKTSAKDLSKDMQNWEQKKAIEEVDLKGRKTALALWDTNLQAREERLKRTEGTLSLWQARLEDERDSLESGFRELKTSRLSPK